MSNRPTIYLDHAATTPALPEVIEAVAEASAASFGNPSSQHSAGEYARRRLDDAREFLRGTLCAHSLVLTSGGTEADLLGVIGAAQARPRGRVLCGAGDHAAVLAQERMLTRLGYRLETLPLDGDGVLDPETLYDSMSREVRVVALLHGHNELGSLQPIDELVEVVRRVAPDAHVHVDLVQAYGKIDFDLDHRGVDSVAISGHKLHAPRGIGALGLSSKAQIEPLAAGGGQENGLRGGTENVAGAVGLATAAEHAFSYLQRNAEHMSTLAARFFETVREELTDVERLGDPKHRLPHVLSLRIPGVRGHSLQQRLAARGVAISTGSACHEGQQDSENHVLKAIGLTKKEAREVIRVSFSAHTTAEDAQRGTDALLDEAEALLAASVSGRR